MMKFPALPLGSRTWFKIKTSVSIIRVAVLKIVNLQTNISDRLGY